MIAFFHIACIGNYQEVTLELIEACKKADLKFRELHIGIAGNYKDFPASLFNELAEELIIFEGNINDFEFSTLEKLEEYAKANPNEIIFYFHTKGVSKITTYRKYWRKAMIHYCITQWQNCVEHLLLHDAVGYNWRGDHFAGNFWWVNASTFKDFIGFKHLRKFPTPIQPATNTKGEEERLQAEFFWPHIKDLTIFSVGFALPFDGISIDPMLPIEHFNKDPFDNLPFSVDFRYCINLDNRPDKWENAQTQFKLAGIQNVKRFSAVPAKIMELASTRFDNSQHINYGAVGCFLSHYMLLRQAWDEGHEWALITEDDVEFVKGFQEYLPEQIQYLPEDCDILWIGGYERGPVNNKGGWPKKIIKELITIPSDIWGTHCYLIRRSGIEKWLRFFNNRNLFTHIDIIMSRYIPYFNQYAFSAPLANQSPNLKSDIH